jgi:hypothetical protein
MCPLVFYASFREQLFEEEKRPHIRRAKPFVSLRRLAKALRSSFFFPSFLFVSFFLIYS